MSLLQTIKFSEINNIYSIKEKNYRSLNDKRRRLY